MASKNNANDNRRAKSTMRAASSIGTNGSGNQQKPSSMANMTKMRIDDQKLATQAIGGGSNIQLAMA